VALVLPKGFSWWPTDQDEWKPEEVPRMYAAGYAGCCHDEEAKADLLNSVRWPRADDVCHSFRLTGAGEGRLSLIFPAILQLYPGALPGPAQARGDCVSHDTKNAGLGSMCCEIVSGKPDEVSKKIEGAPKVSEEGIRNGVLSSEAVYWYRDHNGDGWSCGHAANVVRTESGLWLRQDYPELGFDLTRYSGKLAGKWGKPNPPDEVTNRGRQHLIRTVTNVDSKESLRDLLANGYAVSTCGGEGWSSSRDENGFSKRQGGWSHALAILGIDCRQEIVDLYGDWLVLIQNSWGKWNSGGRRILGTTIDIPEGSFWARYRDCARRDMYAFSSFDGWPAQKLPDWGSAVYLN